MSERRATPVGHTRPRTVVCGMDFSPTALAALELAVATAHGGTVYVVTAHEVSLPSLSEARLRPAQTAELEVSTQKQLDALVTGYRERGVTMHGRVVTGPAETAILETARDTESDLVVVGTHGRTGLARLALGSVAERVVRLCPIPVLTVPLVRNGESIASRPVSLVLAATDFSPDADAAVRAAVALAPAGSTLHLVHVLESSRPGPQEDFADSARHIHELALEREAIRYAGAGLNITHCIRTGVADEEILREATRVAADRIVIGTAGRKGLDRLLLGSVAECVVRSSRIPVLVVRRSHAG